MVWRAQIFWRLLRSRYLLRTRVHSIGLLEGPMNYHRMRVCKRIIVETSEMSTSVPRTRTVLVTGGAGFIGSHLVEALLRSGCAVRVLDNFTTGRHDNVAAAAEVINADIRD